MQWEHKIRKAYQHRDENYAFENKKALWKRISQELEHGNGVAAFWKVAALVFAFLLVGGAFAAFSWFDTQNKRLTQSKRANQELKCMLDSLQNTKPAIITEIQVVEKEKVVYREIDDFKHKQIQFERTINQLENERKQLQQQINAANNELTAVRDSLVTALALLENETENKGPDETKSDSWFSLKTKGVTEQLQPVSSGFSPGMKIQLFKIQDKNIKYDTGATLFKK